MAIQPQEQEKIRPLIELRFYLRGRLLTLAENGVYEKVTLATKAVTICLILQRQKNPREAHSGLTKLRMSVRFQERLSMSS
jgi:hypothetical protein